MKLAKKRPYSAVPVMRALAAGDEPERRAIVWDLYRKLESIVMPLYYRERARYQEVMRHAIALNGSFFNTERMMSEYARQAYRMSEQERRREGKRRG